MKYTIGVDIGGTNTDSVLVDENNKIIEFVKSPTTKTIEEGFYNSITSLLKKSKISVDDIKEIYIGTTHVINAILEKKDLFKVGLIRIAGQYPENISPCFEFEELIRDRILIDHVTIDGGNECDGSIISKFQEKQAKNAIKRLIKNGAESIAVISVFSPMYHEMENLVCKLIQEIKGKDFPVSLSHKIGGIGFIERENTTILNASLQKSLKRGFCNLEKKLKELKIKASLFFTQNNGSMLSLEKALEYPILTLSSGATNSFIGASKLANKKNCIVVDIGGTSTDVGIVKDGLVRRSFNLTKIGGISLNFLVPNILSIALGGGSKIVYKKNEILIGPDSVGKNIIKDALCFGGKVLTLTDIALMINPMLINSKINIQSKLKDAKKILNSAFEKIKRLIFQIEGIEKNLPVILVGGGAILFQTLLKKRYIIPKFYNVANAYGAALAEISNTEDIIVSLNNRKKVLDKIKKRCLKNIIEKGALRKKVRIADIQILPYHYIPNNIARVIVTSLGKKK